MAFTSDGPTGRTRQTAGRSVLESGRSSSALDIRFTMNRRTVLRNGVAVGTLVALAGCTNRTLEEGKSQAEPFDELYHHEEIDLPVEQKFGHVEEGVRLAEDAAVETPEEFEAYLGERGLAVEGVSEFVRDGDTILSLEYTGDDERERGRALELGIVAGAYAAFVDAGYDGEELDVTLLAPDGEEFGEFAVTTSAAEHYNEGRTSAATYGKEAKKELRST